MNHPYPDNYHGGYIRGGPAGMQQQGMGYGHGGYDNPASMARMGHPRHGYNPMPQQYGDNRGQMNPMMQQQQHPVGGGMYSTHGGGYMGQMAGSGHYGGMGTAGNYPGYSSMPNTMNPNHPGMSHMGQGRGLQHHHGNSMMAGGGAAGSSYYNSHPHPASHPHHHQQQHQHLHTSQQHAATNPIANQQPTPPPNYGHQSPSGNSTAPNTNPSPAMTSASYGQQQNQNATSQATHHHHPSPHNTNNMQVNNNPNTNHTPSSIPPSTTPTHNMPTTTQAALTNNIQAQGNSQQQMGSLQNNSNMMMSNSHAHTHGHSQPRPPVAGSMPMSMAANSGGGGVSGPGSSHPIPQHPMRHPTTQQSPQEVADNILQIASSYPTNQTVQVPLKGQARHAPYHIPRSPHHFNTSPSPSSTSTSTSSSITSADNCTNAAASTAVATPNQFQQQQLHYSSVASPPAACSSQQSQPNMSPSTSSNVRSPNPTLTPIPNPIPSPGISGIRSPPSSHCLSPCSSQQQRSPGQMASSISSSSYSGHNQHAPSPSPQHYSPISGGGTPQHLSASFAHSPPSYHPSNNQAGLPQSTADNQSMYGNYSHMNANAHHQHQQSSSPYTGNNMTSPAHPNIPSGGQYNHHQQPSQQCGTNNGNNPLMSLQKLVMLPETQVVDPKSVVNDACLAAASANESNVNTDSKNCESPAERFVESSGLSVGSSGESSSLSNNDCQPHESALQWSQDPQAVCSTAASSSNNCDTVTVAPADDVVDGEVNGTSSKDVNEADCPLSNADSISPHAGDNDAQKNDTGVDENVFIAKTSHNESERQEFQLEDQTNIMNSETDSLETVLEENKFSDKKQTVNLLQQLPSVTFLGHKSNLGNEYENHNKIIVKEETKTEEEHTVGEHSISKVSEDTPPEMPDTKEPMGGMPVIEESKFQNEEDPIKKSENLSCVKKEDSSPVKKEDAQCEPKQISQDSISPTVLSEVQVVVNGNHVVSNTQDGEDGEVLENVQDEECKKVTRARLRNGLKSVVRSKIAKTSKKASQFLRLTTPCSIAVGADEREVCEQFAFRRNGYCHALRASRLLYNGRGRQDSTSHGESDESVENVSDTIIHNLGTPQDGNKRKNVPKKTDAKQPNSNNQTKTNTNGKEGIAVKGHTNVRHSSLSNSNVQKSDASGRANSQEQKDPSDEDGDMCYYEGVDSTDFFMNNNSSDDSFSSSPDSKKKKEETVTGDAQEELPSAGSAEKKKSVEPESKDDSSSALSSPPSKRTRRSPPCKPSESAKKKKDGVKDESDISQVLSDVIDIQSKKNGLSTKMDENSSDRENGKVTKTRLNRRKQVFGKLLAPEEQTIVPELLVKLEKSKFLESSKIDLTDSTPKEEDVGASEKTEKSTLTSENIHMVQIKEEIVKSEPEESSTQHKAQPPSMKTKGTPTKKKRPTSKNRQKGNHSIVKDKDEEVRDSFKSMKFGRTLDMMKSQRKKEQNVTGPFIRIIGTRTTPKKVSVMNQTQNVSASANNKPNQKSLKQSATSSAVTIHMMSNLSSNKTALVTSTKTVRLQTWVCAFCNHQSSFHSLGDLFGPYYKEADIPEVEHLALEEAKKAKDNEKKSDKKGQCTSISPSSSKVEKKGNLLSKEKKGPTPSKGDNKKPLASQPSSLKKRKLSGGKKEYRPLEIWVHQACALWAPGVYVIGNRLYGMDEAMKDAAETICSLCKETGAMVGCLHKGCAMKYHISCAIDEDCALDEENLSLLCPKHKDKKMRISASTSTIPLS